MIRWMMLFLSWSANATCVTDLGYPDQFTLPTLERWSKNSLLGAASAESECRMVQTLARSYDRLTKLTTGPRAREDHAKGVCLEGTFRPQYDAHLSESRKALLRTAEVFSNDEKRAAFVRFSNGAPQERSDWLKDVRGLAFRVDLGRGRSQDFSFDNAPRFRVDGLFTFVRVTELSVGLLEGEIQQDRDGPKVSSMYAYFNKLHGPFGAARSLLSLNSAKTWSDENAGFHDSFLTQAYWSATPFAVGDSNRDVGEAARVVRFGAVPCGERRAPLGSEEEARATSHLRGVERGNYLGEDLLAAVKYKPRCFHVFAQFLEDERSTLRGGRRRSSKLVEDASIKWDAPLLTVGELIVEKPIDQGVCDDPRYDVDVSRNRSGIVGVGALNRARAFVETNQRSRR